MTVRPKDCGHSFSDEELKKLQDAEDTIDPVLKHEFIGKPIKICATHENWLHLSEKLQVELQRRYFNAGWKVEFEQGIEQGSSCISFTPLE